MKIIVKLLVGILYMLTKYVVLLAATVLVFIWELNIECVKELWEGHKAFYIVSVFNLERYRYNTLWDYVKDNKDYSNTDSLFKIKMY